MQLKETTDNGETFFELSGAPIKSAIEIRWQNTLSGMTYVDVVETDDSGSARMSLPYGYQQGFVPKARILKDKTGSLVPFSFVDGSFVTEKTEQTAAVNTPNVTPPKG